VSRENSNGPTQEFGLGRLLVSIKLDFLFRSAKELRCRFNVYTDIVIQVLARLKQQLLAWLGLLPAKIVTVV
jgi:hypothetical protein